MPTIRSLAKTAAYSVARLSYERSLPVVLTRDELPHLLNSRKLLGVGAEIGVENGAFSAKLLGGWHGAKLISIDPGSKPRTIGTTPATCRPMSMRGATSKP